MAMKVLLASDGSAFGRRAAEFLVRMSKVLTLDAEAAQVVDLHYVEYKMLADLYVDMIKQGATEAARQSIEKETAFLASQGVAARPKLLQGRPGPALCQAAEEEGFDLLVMGRKGHKGDLSDVLFGSVSNYAVHHCRRPVLIVKFRGPQSADPTKPLRVLAGVDGSQGSDRCVDLLAGLGAPEALDVCLLNVVNPEKEHLEHVPGEVRMRALESLHAQAKVMLEARAERLRAAGVKVITRVEEGAPQKVICRVFAEDGYELVATGRRGTGELEDAVFGSVSAHVLHHCPGHVLMVP